MILYILSVVLLIESGFMLLPIVTAIIYHETAGWHFVSVALGAAAAAGLCMKLLKPRNKNIYAKEGLLTVSLCWIVLSLVGALPFTLSGEIPFYLDAVFEMVSGFTTTGSSILTNVEELSHCMLLWRSFSHWLGGMGVLVFMLAIFRLEGGQAIHLLRAESPGPTVSKMVPKMVDSSKIVYTIYFVLTIVEMGFYLAGGMPVFDTICNAFGTAGTGGFAIKADSFAGYSYYLQSVTTVFMLLFGVNFSVYFFLLRRKFELVKNNTELRWYVAIVVLAIAAITANTASMKQMYDTTYDAFHHASFAVATVITTTGYGTVDFSLWPEFSRCIMVALMFIGASAGSTGGGFKVSRLVILAKSAKAELRRLTHPHTVEVVKMDGKTVSRETISAVSFYFVIYILIFLVSVLLVSLDGYDGSTTFTAVAATFNNIGPGLNLVGPAGNYAFFSPFAKVVLCLDMLLGRLELYPVLALLMPGTWMKKG